MSVLAIKKNLVSIITPAFNESKNLPLLFERLCQAFAPLGIDWEWVVVDDHSKDTTADVLAHLSQQHPNVRGFRLARNSGSHRAITCGLDQALGDCAILMAADLQDPPEAIGELVEKWKTGAQVVWAVRQEREGERQSTLFFSRVYWEMMRRIGGLSTIPATGADFFLIDRAVIEGLSKFREVNLSLYALITWMGFRQSEIRYTKQARVHGQSGWSLDKKIKLFADSITSFTYFPIRLISYFGSAVALAGFIYALLILSHSFSGERPQGWSSLMVVVLLLGGIQMLMLGVLGEYLWRALEETRQRPRYLIEWSCDPRSAQKRAA